MLAKTTLSLRGSVRTIAEAVDPIFFIDFIGYVDP